jgi:DNA repair protein RadC
MTRTIVAAGTLLGVDVFDHFVVACGSGETISIRDIDPELFR